MVICSVFFNSSVQTNDLVLPFHASAQQDSSNSATDLEFELNFIVHSVCHRVEVCFWHRWQIHSH